VLTVSNGKRIVTVWRLSVCLVGIFTVPRQELACDAASVHFGPTIMRTDIPDNIDRLVRRVNSPYLDYSD